MIIYHIVASADWDKFAGQNTYQAAGYSAEGFIHLSTAEQVAGVLERYYAGATDLRLLHINTDVLTAQLKWEAASNGELFPHLYGPLNKNAIEKIDIIP